MDGTVWAQLSKVARFASMVGAAILWSAGNELWADETNSLSTTSSKVAIPPTILLEAQRRGIALPTIKMQGEYWIGCDGTEADASCTVLGKVVSTTLNNVSTPQLTNLPVGAVLEVHQYGQPLRTMPVSQPNPYGTLKRDGQSFTFELKTGVEARIAVQGKKDLVIDTLPRFRREGLDLVRTKDFQLVRDYIDARPNESFKVIVTVPAMCEPCRQLDKMIQDNFGAVQGATTTPKAKLGCKLFILEYFTFADAERECLGTGAVFPTTLFFNVEPQPRKSVARFIGNLRGNSFEEISRPLASKFRRGAPHTMSRGMLTRDMFTESSTVQLSQR